MIAQQSIAKLKEQANQFAQVLSLEYNVPVLFDIQINMDKSRQEKIEAVLQTVSEFHEIPVNLLTKKGRQREIVEARQVAATLLYREFKLTKSLKKTGLLLGGQDHSTIIHAMQTVDDLRHTDKSFAFRFLAVCKAVEAKIGTP